MTPTVDQLIEQARAGSEEAFYDLARLFQARVRGFVRRYVWDRSAADDVAQETLFAAYRSLDRYTAEIPFDLWILGIARNCALMHLRGEARRRTHEAGYLQAALAQWAADRLGGDSRIELRDRELLALRECLKRLPPESGQLVTAYYAERASSIEIARRTGRKESAVRMALVRIRQALKECVQSKCVALENP
jgi:RNA polymerase sigma-70 factor (ECF subfamily)